MARIRTIKPDFFTSLTTTQLPPTARLTFIGLWTHVDDEGRCVDEPRLIAAALWPLDDHVGASAVDGHLEDLERLGLIVRYRAAGRPYLQVCGWDEHQRINRPTPSKIPPPDQADEPSGTAHEPLTEDSPQEGNREQGREQGQGASADADAADAAAVRRFEEHFWPVYPPTNGVKRDKQSALREWCKLTVDEQRAAVVGARHKAQHFHATGEQPPYALRFLKRRDFLDFQAPVTVDRGTGQVRPPPIRSCPDCHAPMDTHDDEACELVKAGKL